MDDDDEEAVYENIVASQRRRSTRGKRKRLEFDDENLQQENEDDDPENRPRRSKRPRTSSTKPLDDSMVFYQSKQHSRQNAVEQEQATPVRSSVRVKIRLPQQPASQASEQKDKHVEVEAAPTTQQTNHEDEILTQTQTAEVAAVPASDKSDEQQPMEEQHQEEPSSSPKQANNNNQEPEEEEEQEASKTRTLSRNRRSSRLQNKTPRKASDVDEQEVMALDEDAAAPEKEQAPKIGVPSPGRRRKGKEDDEYAEEEEAAVSSTTTSESEDKNANNDDDEEDESGSRGRYPVRNRTRRRTIIHPREAYNLRDKSDKAPPTPTTARQGRPPAQRRKKKKDKYTKLAERIAATKLPNSILPLDTSTSTSGDSADEDIQGLSPMASKKRDEYAHLGPINAAQIFPSTKKSKADIDPMAIDKNVSWDSIGGLQHHVKALKEMVVLPLLYPEVFEKFAITPPRFGFFNTIYIFSEVCYFADPQVAAKHWLPEHWQILVPLALSQLPFLCEKVQIF